MATKRRAAAVVVDKTEDVEVVEIPHDNGTTGSGAPIGAAPRKRRRLEGLAYYVVYAPAVFCAAFLALLFTHAVEHYLYGDEDEA